MDAAWFDDPVDSEGDPVDSEGYPVDSEDDPVDFEGDPINFEGDVSGGEWQIYRKCVDKLDFSEEEEIKRLYALSIERESEDRNVESSPVYAVRAIKLKELLDSSSNPWSELPIVAKRTVPSIMSNEPLPDSIASLFGSEILLAGRCGPVYAFDTNDHELKLKEGVSLPPDIPYLPSIETPCPLMLKLGGKLYAVSCCATPGGARLLLHVFDTDKGTWELLPSPDFTAPYDLNPFPCYAVVGNKLLWFMWSTVSHKSMVFCFDPESGGKPWKSLRTPRYSFAWTDYFQGKALVLIHKDINLLFFFDGSIGVYTMNSLDDVKEDEEFCKLIGLFMLPQLPLLPGELSKEDRVTSHGEFVHIGGRKVCFVTVKVTGGNVWLVAIPFQFDIDTTGESKCFTLNFMPACCSRYTIVPNVDMGRFLL